MTRAEVRVLGPLDTWALVRAAADRAASAARAPTSGIWELREPRDLVSADIGRWICLDRAIWIARGWRPDPRRHHWKRARQEIATRVLSAIGDDGGRRSPMTATRPATPRRSWR